MHAHVQSHQMSPSRTKTPPLILGTRLMCLIDIRTLLQFPRTGSSPKTTCMEDHLLSRLHLHATFTHIHNEVTGLVPAHRRGRKEKKEKEDFLPADFWAALVTSWGPLSEYLAVAVEDRRADG